jgi:hypothetical protein
VTDPVHQQLRVEPRSGYLYVVYGSDTISLQMIVETINAVAKGIREFGYTRVLLIRNGPLLESDAARAMVASMIKNLVGDDVRYAIVDGYGNDPEQTRRAVEASRAAGWDLHGFDTEEEAEAWLLSE